MTRRVNCAARSCENLQYGLGMATLTRYESSFQKSAPTLSLRPPPRERLPFFLLFTATADDPEAFLSPSFFSPALCRSSMVAHSFMAVAANRRLVPRATKSLAAREEKPAHDTARNARYILSCLTTLTAEGEARPIEGQDARPTRRRSGPLGFAATDCYATRDSRGEGRGVAHRSCRNHLWRIS